MRPGYHSWTQGEVETLLHMHDVEGCGWPEIAAALDLPVDKVINRYNTERDRKRREAGTPSEVGGMLARHECDRAARAEAADRRTITQRFFGDPPPGYSAADGKKGMR